MMEVARRRRRMVGGAAPVDYAALVQTRLAGTTGFVMDPSDTTLLWEESTRTTPVNANADPVGAQDSKYGTTLYRWIQATSSRIPASSNLRSVAYATDDFLGEDGSLGFYQSLTGMTLTVRGVITSLAAVNTLLNIATGASATSMRYGLSVNADGSVAQFARRANADGGTTVSSAASLITTNVPFTLQSQINFTTDVSRILLNGSEVATGTQGGVSGAACDAGAPLRIRWGANLSSANFLNGSLGRAVWSPSYLDATGLAQDRGYVEAIAL